MGCQSDRSTRRCGRNLDKCWATRQETRKNRAPCQVAQIGDNQPHRMPLHTPCSFCESGQVGVCRIAFVSDMCGKDDRGVLDPRQPSARAHSGLRAQMDLTSAQDGQYQVCFGTIGVIQDHNIEIASCAGPEKSATSVRTTLAVSRTIEDSAAGGPSNRVQHRSHLPGAWFSGKRPSPNTWPHREGLPTAGSGGS